MRSKWASLTISMAGMDCNCVKEFQRGSSDGNMNNMRGRRKSRVNMVSVALRWNGRRILSNWRRWIKPSTHTMNTLK